MGVRCLPYNKMTDQERVDKIQYVVDSLIKAKEPHARRYRGKFCRFILDTDAESCHWTYGQILNSKWLGLLPDSNIPEYGLRVQSKDVGHKILLVSNHTQIIEREEYDDGRTGTQTAGAIPC